MGRRTEETSFSSSSVTRYTQNKTTPGFHHTPVSIADEEEAEETRGWEGCKATEALMLLLELTPRNKQYVKMFLWNLKIRLHSKVVFPEKLKYMKHM